MLTAMLLMAESCLFRPTSTAMSLKLLTPVPPVQVHVVAHATVSPSLLSDVS